MCGIYVVNILEGKHVCYIMQLLESEKKNVGGGEGVCVTTRA